MAYNLTRYEHQLMNGADATSTSTVARKSVGTRPFTLRRLSMMITVAGTVAAIVVTVSKRVTPGVAGTTIGTLTAPSATSVAGTLVMLDDLEVVFDYGDELYVAVTTAATSTGSIDVHADLEDLPSNPDASTAVTKVTA